MYKLSSAQAKKQAAIDVLRYGAARFDRSVTAPDGCVKLSSERFIAETANMPVDPDCINGGRFRIYTQLDYLPYTQVLEARPVEFLADLRTRVVPFQQAANFNSEQRGKIRYLGAFPDELVQNLWFRYVVATMFELTGLDPKLAYRVGAHVIELRPRPGAVAESSPAHTHRDSDISTAAILLVRQNIVGGENFITDPEVAKLEIRGDKVNPANVRDRFVLKEPLSGYIVLDEAVAHDVMPVALAPGTTHGCRRVLLVDFNPLHPVNLLV
jgi:hypothetical protein